MQREKPFSIKSGIDDKLKTLGSTLVLKEAPPIHQKRLVAFYNHFVIGTVDFLNTFAQSCSQRLFEIEQKMCKLEAELRLLEAKLKSVPDLDDKKDVNVDLPSPLSFDTVDSSENKENGNQAGDNSEGENASKNPLLAKFVNMVKVGVNVEAVILQMKLENVDPSLLKL